MTLLLWCVVRLRLFGVASFSSHCCASNAKKERCIVNGARKCSFFKRDWTRSHQGISFHAMELLPWADGGSIMWNSPVLSLIFGTINFGFTFCARERILQNTLENCARRHLHMRWVTFRKTQLKDNHVSGTSSHRQGDASRTREEKMHSSWRLHQRQSTPKVMGDFHRAKSVSMNREEPLRAQEVRFSPKRTRAWMEGLDTS